MQNGYPSLSNFLLNGNTLKVFVQICGFLQLPFKTGKDEKNTLKKVSILREICAEETRTLFWTIFRGAPLLWVHLFQNAIISQELKTLFYELGF